MTMKGLSQLLPRGSTLLLMTSTWLWLTITKHGSQLTILKKKLGCLYLNQIRSLASSSVTHAHHYIHDPSLWSILIYPAFFSNFVSKLFSLSCASFSWSLTLTLSPPLLPPVFFSPPVSFLLLSSCHQFHSILFYLYSTNSKKHWNIILEDKDPGINPQQSYNALWANTWQQ